MVGIQDVFNILGYAVALRGELSDVYDFTVFELPGVWAQGAVSHVLAGVGLPGVARAVHSCCSMMWSHHGVEHGCRGIYFSFSQWRTAVSTQRSFSRHCTCKVTLQGPQSVVCWANNCRKFKKVLGVLLYLCYHKGRLNSTKVWHSACLIVTVYR
jgi:hypothetical protein